MKPPYFVSAIALGLFAYGVPAHAFRLSCDTAEYNAENVLIRSQHIEGKPAAGGHQQKALLQNEDKT